MPRPPAYRNVAGAGALLLCALLTACAPRPPARLTAAPLAALTIPAAIPTVVPAAAPPPTNTVPPTPTPLPPPATAVPTIPPTLTPLPQVTLAVPQRWLTVAQEAVAAANEESAAVQWQLGEEITASLRLVQGESQGLPLPPTPLVLAVPFTLDWEEVTAVTAQDIVAQGDERVTVKPWAELQAHEKALRIDGLGPEDTGYPLQEQWSLVGADEQHDAAAKLLPYLQAAWPRPPLHLLAVGDIMLDRSLGYALQNGDLEYPFVYVAGPLRAADITVGNVESALGDSGEPAPKRYPFRAPPQAAEALALAGFDIVSLANNHAMDFGPQALLQAIDLLRAQGIATAGAGADAAAAHAPAFISREGLDLAFLSYVDVPVEASTGFDTASWTATVENPGLAWADPARMKADITAVRSEVDLVVVLLHSGFEYQAAPSEAQQTAARAAIQAGADLVIGHHAHILQGIEYYRDGVILYGTGNFAFDIDGDPQTALFHVWLDQDGVREIRIDPALVQFGGQPRPAEPWLAPPIRRTVYALTGLLNGR